MATFRKKRSKQYKSRTKSRRNYTNKRRGKKTLRGGVFGLFRKSSQVTPVSSQASSLPLKNESLDEEINSFSKKIESEMSKITNKDTEENNEQLETYIDSIKRTSQDLAVDYNRLMQQMNKSKTADELFKQNNDLLDNHINMLDIIYSFNDKASLNTLKVFANNAAIGYYTGLLQVITKKKNTLPVN